MSRRSRLEWILADAGAREGTDATEVRSVVAAIDTKTNRLTDRAIKTGPYPSAIAMTPDGARAYVVKD